MSQGAYLEFANRAFDKVDVTVDFSNKKDWEHGVYPQWENPVLTKKRYLSSTQHGNGEWKSSWTFQSNYHD